jgi:serine/threonine-protein kinase
MSDEICRGAESDLLAGVLALHARLIDADDLQAALDAPPDRPPLDALIQSGRLPAELSGPLDQLARAYLARRKGEDWLGLLAGQPGLHERLCQRLFGQPTQSVAPPTCPPDEPLTPTASEAPPTQPPTTRYSTPPSPRDDVERSVPTGLPHGTGPCRYRRVALHARGGLGAVFVAQDEELNRLVALKEIQERHADHSSSQTRFVFEAEVTGNLEHPGIVPVYGLGRYPDGRPYYAMRFIRGQSLDEEINRFHQADQPGRDPGERALALRGLLRRFVDVCNAVAYAHSRGVIHRDIKPANIMLGEFGETLVVDWGLAKLRESEEQGSEGSVRPASAASMMATMQGASVGTPAYMPPEQVLGEHEQVGPHSDVYSLGATLYHLLTGQVPFSGAALEDVLEKVVKGDYPPARKVKAVPAALEAVCGRAMAVDPGQRYESARALAEEVERWLADEPVQAYREPLADRVRRWGRRHRTLVSSIAVLLVTGVLGLSLGLVFVYREKARTEQEKAHTEREKKRTEIALVRAVKAEENATANLRQAETNLKLARQAIDECFNIAQNHELFQRPGMEQAKKLLLETTLPFYKRFRAQRPDDRGLERDEANQWFRVAYIEEFLGRTTRARQAYEKARDLLRRLVKAFPDRTQYQHTLASAHTNLGNLLSEQGKHEQALVELRTARDLHGKLVKAHPRVASYRRDLAATHINLGWLLRDLGKRAAALKEFEQARDLEQKLVKDEPNNPQYQQDLANNHNNLGVVLDDLGKSEQAGEEYRRARGLLRELVDLYPEVPAFRNDLGRTYNNLAQLLNSQGKREQALMESEKARNLQEKLVAAFPDVAPYQSNLAHTHNQLGRLLAAQDKGDQALAEYQQAIDLYSQLARAHPRVPGYQKDLAATHNNRGVTLEDLGKRRQALAEHIKARDLRGKLVKAYPTAHVYQEALAQSHDNLAILLEELGERDESLAEYGRAINLRDKLARAFPDVPELQNDLARSHYNLGKLLLGWGKFTEAHSACKKARDIQQKLVKAHPAVPRYQHDLGQAHNTLGVLLRELGKRDEAVAEYQQARAHHDRLTRAYPDLPAYRQDLALASTNLGVILAELGKHDQALKEYQQALLLQQKLVKDYPAVPGYQHELAGTYFKLGLLLVAQRKYEAALKEYGQSRDHMSRLVKDHPGVPKYVELLARTCLSRGALLIQMERLDDSLKDLDEGIRRTDELHRLNRDNLQVPGLLVFGLNQRAIVLTCLDKAKDADADWNRALKVASKADRLSLRISRADIRARVGDYRQAAAEAEDLAKGSEAAMSYDLARVLSLSAAAASRDVLRPLPEREKNVEVWSHLALDLLRRAQRAGLFDDPKNVAALQQEEDLAYLRSRDDGKRFLAGLKSPR